MKPKLIDAIKEFEYSSIYNGSIKLLDSMGYRSDRTLEQTGDPKEFFLDTSPDTLAKSRFMKDAKEIYVVFQFTGSELDAGENLKGSPPSTFENRNDAGFIFTAVDLNHKEEASNQLSSQYSRSDYIRMTREVNKRYPKVPSIVLFRADRYLTLGFLGRRPNLLDDSKDVLERVSIVKDIYCRTPHRAHVDTLTELSVVNLLAWMIDQEKEQNFRGLHDAWLKKLDTEELNKRFYYELFDWFENAVSVSKFPNMKIFSTEEHIIRLITRLMFVWFLKEKSLVAPALFEESQMNTLLENYDSDTGDTYYRAILQNLFFATLNNEIPARRFSEGYPASGTCYRYEELINDTETLMDLFDETPFINGGLFECLDKDHRLVDCFTDDPIGQKELSIPNHLFFGDGGIISIFKKYRFTVEENTPIENEVALDPELLGRVFENLLAAYNPETRVTARNQTGSFYTPRPVVDYMVKESISRALIAKVKTDDEQEQQWNGRLRLLLDESIELSDADLNITEDVKRELVEAIATLTVLDPAVGSGAFAMTALHVLTLALRRLDPSNKYWKQIQKRRASSLAGTAYEIVDDDYRQEILNEVESTFKRYRDTDFGRKLFLIQNSLFGVDIQPIACQIAKLRFFISLAIEQVASSDRHLNYGIIPLPNLETRFVAADSLLSAKDEGGQLLEEGIKPLIEELRLNRERHFNASTVSKKHECRKQDENLRARLVDMLGGVGFADAAVKNIASWDPYNQNAVAQWFEPEYMFGVENFDVVIGNPPYIQLQRNRGELGNRYKNKGYQAFAKSGDIYQLFIERGMNLIRPEGKGILTFITSNSWLKAKYGKALRNYLHEYHSPLVLIEMGENVFENACVDVAIFIIQHGKQRKSSCLAVDLEHAEQETFPPSDSDWNLLHGGGEAPWIILSSTERAILKKMEDRGTPLGEWDLSIHMGIKTGFNEAFIVDQKTRDAIVNADPISSEILKPVLRGSDITRYRANWKDLYLIDTHNGFNEVPAIDVNDYPGIKNHLKGFWDQLEVRQDQGQTPYNLRSCAYHDEFQKRKLLWAQMPATHGRFALADPKMVCNQKCFLVTGDQLEYLCAILNSSLINWFINRTSVTTAWGTTQWDKYKVEALPIPYPDKQTFATLSTLVNSILDEIDKGLANGKLKTVQRKIDQKVFALYGLTSTEIEAVTQDITEFSNQDR